MFASSTLALRLRGSTIWSRHAALPLLCSAGLSCSCPQSHSREIPAAAAAAARSQVSCRHPCPCCHPHPGIRRRQEKKQATGELYSYSATPVTSQAAKPASTV